MATYAIGDVQGCFRSLEALLSKIAFDPGRDRLWLVGDLVNRGPRSLEVLRWAHGLRERITVVLGNHEMHLLALAARVEKADADHPLQPILTAPDAEELLAWVRGLPFTHREGNRLLVHAGLLPAWTLEQAEELARQAEAALRGPQSREFLAMATAHGPDKPPSPWPELEPAVAALTRLRVCDSRGRMRTGFPGPPEKLPAGLHPWYELPHPRPKELTVLFGHWSSLGPRGGPGFFALDSGCVWGNSLTALRLEDGRLFQVPPAPDEHQPPKRGKGPHDGSGADAC